MTAFGAVQDYVEKLTRARIADLPDGTWETEDHVDFDPGGEEGLVTVKVKLTIDGDEILYDLNGSDPAIKIVPQLRRGRGVQRRDRLRQDVPAGDPAQLRLLPRDQGRRRTRGHDRQRGLAERRHRVRSAAPTRRS